MRIDASKFLAQSQSRMGLGGGEERQQRPERSPRARTNWRPSTPSRNQQQRRPNPYQSTASQNSGFPFASRFGQQQAPLFYSAADEFREENDEEEHEREIADYYALQKSRRQLGGSELKESSEADPDESLEETTSSTEYTSSRITRPRGIRSSWKGGASDSRIRQKPPMSTTVEDDLEDERSESTSNGKGKMVEIGLGDTLRSEVDDDPPDDFIEDPPSIQQLRKPIRLHDEDDRDPPLMGMGDEDDDDHALLGQSHAPSSLPDDLVPQIVQPVSDPPRHDVFWGHIYLLSLAAMFATWFLVYLHTEPPGLQKPIGDTVYTTLHASFHLLAIYTIVSIFVSLFWLAALRSYVRYLVYGILVAVPVILYAFSLYPFISSFTGTWHGDSLQDTVMRYASLAPALIATLWILAVIRGRLVMQKAISILEFATRILGANPALLIAGFVVLGTVVGFTWVWLSMFTRVFLGGHQSTRSAIGRFIIDASTWWLGVYFILVYLWSIAIIFGLQRTITSATVSQWYFHRLTQPAPTSQTVVRTALTHSLTTLFGTIALATGLSLLVRLPLLLLPRRLTMLLGIAMYSLIPTPIAILINPLTLTYAAIHSQPLAISARGLMQMHFLAPTDATTSLHPNTFNTRRAGDGWSKDTSPLMPYRLSKLLLHATRFIMSLALGFGGWVSTARSLKLAGAGFRGSLYAYVVGLIAGAIGWGILGAMEGVLACIVDAAVVCWGSEVGSSGRGEARYCREAGWLFSEDDTIPDEGRVSLA